MARRTNISHSWTLAAEDPVAVPNARITLALLRCVWRLPGAFSAHNFDDLGTLLVGHCDRIAEIEDPGMGFGSATGHEPFKVGWES